MAITSNQTTEYGELRKLYIRLNNVEASNHGVAATALFRGFASKAAYTNGSRYMWERSVEFTADVTQALWTQAYMALKAMPDMSDALDV